MFYARQLEDNESTTLLEVAWRYNVDLSFVSRRPLLLQPLLLPTDQVKSFPSSRLRTEFNPARRWYLLHLDSLARTERHSSGATAIHGQASVPLSLSAPPTD